MTSCDKIAVTKIDVFPERLRLSVRLSDETPRFADESLITKACNEYPTLPLHSCINTKGPTFGDVAIGTSLPHLLEHLVIAEQVRMAHIDATFVGTTHWAEDGPAGRDAIVEVSFLDDLQAFEALRSALAFLNESISGTGSITQGDER